MTIGSLGLNVLRYHWACLRLVRLAASIRAYKQAGMIDQSSSYLFSWPAGTDVQMQPISIASSPSSPLSPQVAQRWTMRMS
jgi:hypothetical protein